jgi:hypothetical protein
MANAMLAKCHDPKLSLCKYLTSQDGSHILEKHKDDHEATKGSCTTNDRVESNFGTYDLVQRMFGTIAVENVSGVAQQMRSKDFAIGNLVRSDRRKKKDDGESQPTAEEVNVGYFQAQDRAHEGGDRRDGPQGARRVARGGKGRHAGAAGVQEQEARREPCQIAQRHGRALRQRPRALRCVEGSRRAQHVAAVQRALGKESNTAGELKYLRNEIEMRVFGLGWSQFETRWSSSSDEAVGTVEYLTRRCSPTTTRSPSAA